VLLGQLVGLVQQAPQVVAHRDIAGLAGHLGQRIQRLGQALAQHRHVHSRLGQQRARAAALLVQQRAEQVNRFDDAVVAAHGQRLCVCQRLLETRGELVHPHCESSSVIRAGPRRRCWKDAVAPPRFKGGCDCTPRPVSLRPACRNGCGRRVDPDQFRAVEGLSG